MFLFAIPFISATPTYCNPNLAGGQGCQALGGNSYINSTNNNITNIYNNINQTVNITNNITTTIQADLTAVAFQNQTNYFNKTQNFYCTGEPIIPLGYYEFGDTYDQLQDWNITGITSSNSNNGKLYVQFVTIDGTFIAIYADAGLTNSVGYASLSSGTGTYNIIEQSGSGIGGSVHYTYRDPDTDEYFEIDQLVKSDGLPASQSSVTYLSIEETQNADLASNIGIIHFVGDDGVYMYFDSVYEESSCFVSLSEGLSSYTCGAGITGYGGYTFRNPDINEDFHVIISSGASSCTAINASSSDNHLNSYFDNVFIKVFNFLGTSLGTQTFDAINIEKPATQDGFSLYKDPPCYSMSVGNKTLGGSSKWTICEGDGIGTVAGHTFYDFMNGAFIQVGGSYAYGQYLNSSLRFGGDGIFIGNSNGGQSSLTMVNALNTFVGKVVTNNGFKSTSYATVGNANICVDNAGDLYASVNPCRQNASLSNLNVSSFFFANSSSVGIGTIRPQYALHISSDSAYPVVLTNSSGTTEFYCTNLGACYSNNFNLLGTSGTITAGSAGSIASRYFQDNSKNKGYWDTGTANINWLNINRVTTNVNEVDRAVASQTADIQQWQNSSSFTRTSINAQGLLQLTPVNLTACGTAYTNFTISANTTGIYGCGNGGSWTKIA